MADMVLRVTPEILRQKADEFTGIIGDIQRHFNRVEEIAARTRGYWLGEAGTRDRESYASYQENIQFIIRRLEEHPADLLAMAGIYSQAETSAVEINAKLQTNQIV